MRSTQLGQHRFQHVSITASHGTYKTLTFASAFHGITTSLDPMAPRQEVNATFFGNYSLIVTELGTLLTVLLFEALR